LRWLSRHSTALVVVVLVAIAWGSVWLVYDYRSPVSQWLRGFGTVQIDGWSAYDLDMQCIRLEPADPVAAPKTTVDAAIKTAITAYPGAYVRETKIVFFHDTCNAGKPTLAWAVSIVWPASPDDILQEGPQPRAVVVVNVTNGSILSNRNERAPVVSPGPSTSPSTP